MAERLVMKSGSTASAIAPAISRGPAWVWTCGGLCFGYSKGNSLFTHDGLEVGRFIGLEIYGPDGRYLGEMSRSDSGGRLITNTYKRSLAADSFVPSTGRGYVLPGQRSPYPIYSGHEDFPSPDKLKAQYFPKPGRTRRIFQDSLGQDLVEYCLAAAFVAVAAGAIMPNMATSISTVFSKVTSVVTAAAN